MTDLIRSARLDLISMTPAFLEASLAGNRARAATLLGVAVPEAWPGPSSWPKRRLDQLRADPDLQPWLTRAMVLRAERRMIGQIGFHGRPGEAYLDELAPGGVEFGYTVFEPDRRRGYAREACTALMEWAQGEHGVRRFVLSISPSNRASLGLARQLGFARIGSHLDDEDGPEEIFGRTLDDERA
jgi:RimJ/RimL family protein N-acetyltransferase